MMMKHSVMVGLRLLFLISMVRSRVITIYSDHQSNLTDPLLNKHTSGNQSDPDFPTTNKIYLIPRSQSSEAPIIVENVTTLSPSVPTIHLNLSTPVEGISSSTTSTKLITSQDQLINSTSQTKGTNHPSQSPTEPNNSSIPEPLNEKGSTPEITSPMTQDFSVKNITSASPQLLSVKTPDTTTPISLTQENQIPTPKMNNGIINNQTNYDNMTVSPYQLVTNNSSTLIDLTDQLEKRRQKRSTHLGYDDKKSLMGWYNDDSCHCFLIPDGSEPLDINSYYMMPFKPMCGEIKIKISLIDGICTCGLMGISPHPYEFTPLTVLNSYTWTLTKLGAQCQCKLLSGKPKELKDQMTCSTNRFVLTGSGQVCNCKFV